jgi:hypothetical protein
MKIVMKIVVMLLCAVQCVQAVQIKNVQALEAVTIQLWNQSVDALKTKVPGLEQHRYDSVHNPAQPIYKKPVRLPMTDANRTFIYW